MFWYLYQTTELLRSTANIYGLICSPILPLSVGVLASTSCANLLRMETHTVFIWASSFGFSDPHMALRASALPGEWALMSESWVRPCQSPVVHLLLCRHVNPKPHSTFRQYANHLPWPETLLNYMFTSVCIQVSTHLIKKPSYVDGNFHSCTAFATTVLNVLTLLAITVIPALNTEKC